MSAEIVRACVLEHLGRLRLGSVADQPDALATAAAQVQPTYLNFLDLILRDKVGAKKRKHIAMGVQIARSRP